MVSEEADKASAADEGTSTSKSQQVNINQVVDERGVPIGNVLAEVKRKLGRMGDIDAKLDMLITKSGQLHSSDKESARTAGLKVDADLKQYVDTRFDQLEDAKVERAQDESLEQVFKTFPELSKQSEDFDNEFFNLAVKYERTLDPKDPDRPMKAAKLAALDVGKIEKYTKAKVLADESRRTRMLAESGKDGGTTAKPAKTQPKMNDGAIQRYFKIDSAKIKKFTKAEEGAN